VPNLTFGPVLLKALRPHTRKPFDAHLMISEPGRYAAAFARAGADLITWHIECDERPEAVLRAIRATGKRPGVCLKPATPLRRIQSLLGRVRSVVVMSVEPGFGGQKFMPAALAKVAQLKALRGRLKARFLIEVDGGVDEVQAPRAIAAGADVLVAGTAVFGKASYRRAIAALRKGAPHV
jgi:ribulose-phosphate 3-epimerase